MKLLEIGTPVTFKWVGDMVVGRIIDTNIPYYQIRIADDRGETWLRREDFKVLGDPEKPQALRYNEGKGEHDYLLTYPGGIDAVFSPDFAYYDTLTALAEWYRGIPNTDGVVDIRFVVSVLRDSAAEAGDDLAAALAETNARATIPREDGTFKYPQGNYLKGANYRQYCQSAIRHAQALQAGETHDAEGNNHLGALVFNILMLDACVTQKIGIDDRIRLPPDTNPSTV